MIQDQAYTATVLAGGTATVRIQTGNRFQRWTISQISVEMASAPIGATCDVRKNGVFITPLIATGDAASGDPPVTLWPGETITVNFAGCTPGDTGSVYVIYDDGQPS